MPTNTPWHLDVLQASPVVRASPGLLIHTPHPCPVPLLLHLSYLGQSPLWTRLQQQSWPLSRFLPCSPVLSSKVTLVLLTTANTPTNAPSTCVYLLPGLSATLPPHHRARIYKTHVSVCQPWWFPVSVRIAPGASEGQKTGHHRPPLSVSNTMLAV